MIWKISGICSNNQYDVLFEYLFDFGKIILPVLYMFDDFYSNNQIQKSFV